MGEKKFEVKYKDSDGITFLGMVFVVLFSMSMALYSLNVSHGFNTVSLAIAMTTLAFVIHNSHVEKYHKGYYLERVDDEEKENKEAKVGRSPTLRWRW